MVELIEVGETNEARKNDLMKIRGAVKQLVEVFSDILEMASKNNADDK